MEDSPNRGIKIHHNSKSSLVVEVKSKKHLDQPFMELNKLILCKLNDLFFKGGYDVLWYQGLLYVSNVNDLKKAGFWRKLMVLVIPFICALQRCIMTLDKYFY